MEFPFGEDADHDRVDSHLYSLVGDSTSPLVYYLHARIESKIIAFLSYAFLSLPTKAFNKTVHL